MIAPWTLPSITTFVVFASGLAAQSVSLVHDIDPGLLPGVWQSLPGCGCPGEAYRDPDTPESATLGTSLRETCKLESELWATDGSSAGNEDGPRHLSREGERQPRPPARTYRGRLYFAAEDAVSGLELWSTDGTAGGDEDRRRHQQGSPFGASVRDDESRITHRVHGDRRRARPGGLGDGWDSAGKPCTGQRRPSWASVGSHPFRVHHEHHCIEGDLRCAWGFGAGSSLGVGWDALRHASAGRVSTRYSRRSVASSSQPGLGNSFRRRRRGSRGAELWSTDGTVAGTRLLKEIRPGSQGSDIVFTADSILNGALYFRADDGVSGPELWRTDGTARRDDSGGGSRPWRFWVRAGAFARGRQ